MAKVRVYELAKELGVESKTVLSMLKDMGEFVRSASSTVEAPVERRLKEKLASEPPPVKKTTTKKAAAAKTADAAPATPAPVAAEVSAEAPASDRAGCATGRDHASCADRQRPRRPRPAAPAAPAAQPAGASSSTAGASRAQLPPAAPTPAPAAPRRGRFRVRACPVRRARPHPLPRTGDGASPRPRPGSTGGLPGGSGWPPSGHPTAGQQSVRILARNGPAAPAAARLRRRRTDRTPTACWPLSNAW